MSAGPRRSVAVIGSGIAGLAAAHRLAHHDRVTLFEADDRLGGHAHTQRVDLGSGRYVEVDTGFIVHNDRTYPQLLELFTELGVLTQETDMSMSVRVEADGMEYAGARGLRGLLPTPGHLVRGRHLRMLAQIPRFHRRARALLDAGADGPGADVTLDEFLTDHRFDDYFATHFIYPLVGAVWSCAPGTAARYPARYLFRFLDHHGMLTVFGSPTWRTVVGGSARYVERIASGLDTVRLSTPVTDLVRLPGGRVAITVTDPERGPVTEEFDAAVIAVHPHQALTLLRAPSADERRVLGALLYTVNHAQLHTDTSVLPRARAARASWNQFTPAATTGGAGVVVTYDLTRLMRITDPDPERRILVTLGGAHLVDPAAVLAEMVYEHPLYTPDSVAARSELPDLDTDTVAYAGAYHGWGFHEDGAVAGLRAARRISRARPAR